MDGWVVIEVDETEEGDRVNVVKIALTKEAAVIEVQRLYNAKIAEWKDDGYERPIIKLHLKDGPTTIDAICSQEAGGPSFYYRALLVPICT